MISTAAAAAAAAAIGAAGSFQGRQEEFNLPERV
jgi:hypothetical protein